MYEEKVRKININWKSLLIKMAILLVAVFILIWLISLFNKEEEKPSNLGTNLDLMKEAAYEYFTFSRLPQNINDTSKLTLEEMFENKLLVEFTDQNGDSCDVNNSYIEATNINGTDYRIEVKLVCNNDSDVVINTILYDLDDEDDTTEDENVIDDDISDEEEILEDDDEDNSNQSTNNTINKPTNNNTSSNNNTNINTNTNTNNNASSNNNSSNNTSNTIVKTCTYGKNSYYTVYPIAYLVDGDCALSYSQIKNGTHANAASDIGIKEYTKLNQEIASLKKTTGADLKVLQPEYLLVSNTTGNGYVGYQIRFIVKQNISTYTKKTIYQYYIDGNGNRKVVIDNRSSLNNSASESPSTTVSSISLNKSSVTLDINDTYTLVATVKPSNSKVTWSSSNTSVASVSSNGIVTAKKAGIATISAKAGNKTATAKIVVNAGYVKLDDSSVTLNVGDTYKAYYDSNLSGTASWSSSNTSVASVNRNGSITALKAGVTTITISINGIYDTMKVYVEESSYIRILDDDSLTVFAGNTYQLSVATNASKVTYTSSNPTVASVNSSGLVTAKNSGWTTIGATTPDGEHDFIVIYVSELSFR